MATQSHSSTASPMPNLNSCFDPDIDPFLNLDQISSYTPSIPSESKGKGIASSSNSSVMSHSQPQQTFSGPSHQYDNYRQQTGLPAGGLANTFAVNQATGMQYSSIQQDGFVMPTETLNIPLSQGDDFDFSQNPSMDMTDMDFDLDSPSDSLSTMMYPPSASSSSQGQFVNPSAIGIKEESPASYPQVQRMYPGMHSAQAAQAAQAKAQAQKRQQEMIKQQKQRALAGQRQLPQEPPRQQTTKAQQVNDPAVEERISQLLQQMRQNSATSQDDDPSTPTASASQMQKMKKDEEDMDEDERLLASEEGKKLSSKERRQLRNKVSARAFRSRRKEYIGQLEGEVAAKTQEANDLRAQNRQLMEENTRLTDLTRMLLSSSAFSGFLTELSSNGLPTPQQSQQPQASHAKPQPTRKDVNPHHAAQQIQNQPQIGMAMIPEQNIDFSMLDAPSNGWNSGMDSYSVFAVTELPRGPAVDTGIMSGKSSNFVEPKSDVKDVPVVPSLPVIAQAEEKSEAVEDTSVAFNAQEFPLFADAPPTTMNSSTADTTRIFGNIPTEKALAHIDLTVVSDTVDNDAVASARLERLCARLDATFDRIGAFVSHLT